MTENCTICDKIDDEQHRLVACKKCPNSNDNNDIQFQNIDSDNIDELNSILYEIEKTWDTLYTNGRMRKYHSSRFICLPYPVFYENIFIVCTCMIMSDVCCL